MTFSKSPLRMAFDMAMTEVRRIEAVRVWLANNHISPERDRENDEDFVEATYVASGLFALMTDEEQADVIQERLSND